MIKTRLTTAAMLTTVLMTVLATFTATSSSMAAEPVADNTAVITDAAPLKPFEARYEARAMGMRAKAYRTLQLVEGEVYRLQNSVTLTLLGATVGSVAESSEFRWLAGDLIPLQYRYDQTGISSRSESVDFDWASNVAQSTYKDESWSLPLQPGIMDKLSYGTRMGRDISTGGLTEVSYNIVDAEDIEVHLYRVTAEEVLSTPAGNLNTLRIERIRDPGSSRKTTVWLAKDWGYLLVRLEQVSDSGTTELELESATVDGQALMGL